MRAASALAVIAALVGAAASVSAVEDRPLSQLYHQAWGIRQGAPGSIVDIAQTADGYLWVATVAGLYRFDGVRFDRYATLSGGLPRRIVRLLAQPGGGLWIGSSEGITLLKNGRAVTYGPAEGVPRATLWDLAADAAGTTWAGTQAGLLMFDGTRWRSSPEWNLPPGVVRAVIASRTGGIWVGTDNGLMWRPPSAQAFRPAGTTAALIGLAEAPDGVIWVAEAEGSTRPAALPTGEPVHGPAIPSRARRLLFDRTGALWLATTKGLVRTRPSLPLAASSAFSTEHFSSHHGLTDDGVFSIVEDREGNVWAGTGAGLDFFRETALAGAPLPPGIHAIRIAAGDDGAVWVGSQNQPLTRIRQGVVTTVPVPPPITGLHRAADGVVFAWGNDRLWQVESGDRVQIIPAPPGRTGDAWSLAKDGQGRLWAAFQRDGLFIWSGGAWSRPAQPELLTPDFRVALTDATGGVWLSQGDTVTMVKGDVVRRYAAADNLRAGRVSAIASGRTGIWIAGDAGLAVAGDHGIRMVTGIDADTIGRITGVAESDDVGLWLNADRGVVWIARDELAKAIAGGTAPAYRVFDYLDGVIGGAAPIPAQSATRTTDGRLWFVGFNNLVSVDPSTLASNDVAPPVHIESVMSGGRSFPLSEDLRVPVGTTNLQIKYTGLSLAMPERVRFRYRLDGADQEWQHAGTRREAIYTNLGPGSYRFQVTASNNAGVWNEHGTSLAFVIPPAFYQTGWFRGFAVLAVAGAVWLMYRRRLQQISIQMHARIEERLTERERIARELHDTLLQGVQGLMLRFQAVATRIPPTDPVAALMEEALTRADDVLVQGRDRVRGLRGVNGSVDDLPTALERAGRELSRDAPAELRVAVEGEPRPLHPVVRDEAYWIGREALVNAFHHAEGERVDVEIAYGGRELRLRLRDNGRGVDPDVMKAGHRAEHWGLPGMRERASRIGAQLELWSRPGAGTEVELRIPAIMAYLEPLRAPRRWPWSRSTGGTIDGRH